MKIIETESNMRKIIHLFSILIISCCCEESNQHAKYFNPEDLSLLDLATIDGFWQDVSSIDTSFRGGGGSLFNSYPGFLDGIGLFDDNNAIWISVFANQDTAINAMESRIANVAVVIQEGTSDEIDGSWWFFDDGWNSAVFVNQWNTIIEVILFNTEFTNVENILYSTANELADRVDDLSD